MPRHQLVIFDCDGVLVDSERISSQVYAELLGELGLAVSRDDLLEHFAGHSMAHCLDRIAALLGRPPPGDLVAAYHARTRRAFETQLRPVPGIEDALAQIATPSCVASNGSVDKMRFTLGLTGLLPRFDGRLFSGYDVGRPKPAPDLHLHAASRCGVAPDACVVVEDSPAGVSAAIAAGMTVLGYAALTPAHRLRAAGAHHLFDRMADLPQLLARDPA
ncbi:MAG TPA: HAD-IA family hydrolase [Kofleriaceae bacterium]|nr:HAD-IA family hydrolase [Kofleriaceae bacterium]